MADGAALSQLVQRELGTVGVRAQDLIDDHDEWQRIEDELSKAWRLCHAGDLNGAAEIARSVSRQVERVVRQQH
jgi:hypothetical protein